MIMLALVAGSVTLGAERYYKMDVYKAAQQKYQAGDYDGAAKDYLQAQRLSNVAADQAVLQYKIAECLLIGKDYENALKAYEAFLQMPEALERYKAIAKQRIPDAKAKHRAVLLGTEGHPYHESQTRFTVGYEYWLDREYAKARTEFAKVIDVEGGHPNYLSNAQFLIGHSYYVTQHYAEARKALTKTLQMEAISPDFRATVLLYIGSSHFNEKNVSEAKAALSEVLEIKGTKIDPKEQDVAVYLEQAQNAVWLYGIHGNRAWTHEEKLAQRTIILKRMSEEGLSKENCRLKGRRILGQNTARMSVPYPESGFPYSWDFEDGTLCGINQQGPGIKNMRVEGGKLKFTTTEESAAFSWGNMDGDKPGLRFGYGAGDGEICPRLGHVKIRLRQSVKESVWQVGIRAGKTKRRERVKTLKAFTVSGTDWQTVTVSGRYPPPPYVGFSITTRTPGNAVEIDWVQPCVLGGQSCYRKTLTLPAGVRWARCSISVNGRSRLYVNGKQALMSPPRIEGKQLWNYDLDPSLFRKGRNAICFQGTIVGTAQFLLDGALLCEDGTYLRFDSDTSWKAKRNVEDETWTTVDYDDSAWSPTYEAHKEYNRPGPEEEYEKFWFNPSYKGQLMVEPEDGRSQPVYGSREDIALRVAVPRRTGEEHAVTYEVYDEMGDYFHASDKLVKEGSLKLTTGNRRPGTLRTGMDDVGLLRFGAGELEYNHAYAVTFRFQVNGKEIESRRYEIAVCGPIEQPVVDNPENYTDGMKLKRVWEVDAAAEPGKGEFISCAQSTGQQVMQTGSTIIKTPLGKFRRTGIDTNNPGTYLSFKYRIERPGRPHVAIAEYPDDTHRIQEMRLTEGSILGHTSSAKTELGNDCAVLGIENPLTHEMRDHHAIFWPNNRIGAVSIFCGGSRSEWTPSSAARVGKIRIYEVLNDIPIRKIVDAPGKTKWFGQHSERGPCQVMQSNFSSPLAALVKSKLILSDTPNFYRNWMVTYINMVKRLRFAGENAYFIGQYMYGGALYPSTYSYRTNFDDRYAGSFRDSGVLMAKMFEENGLGVFSGLEMGALAAVTPNCGDDDIAQGMPTLASVNKDGRQRRWLNGSYIYPNWIHPEVRKHFDTVINELVALYGDQKGWKGIELQVNEALGPCWLSMRRDPYDTSYDDYTIALFEKETGTTIPVDEKDPKRFRKRYDWLMANAKKSWTDWRCAKMTEIYEWVRDRLKSTRPDLDFVLYAQAQNYIDRPWVWKEKKPLPSIYDYGRRGGMDIERMKKDKDIILARSIAANPAARPRSRRKILRHRARTEKYYESFANDGINAMAPRIAWHEPQLFAPEGWVFFYTSPEAWPVYGAEYWGDYYVNMFVRSNPTMILHPLMDLVMWNGRETSVSRFAKAFRSLPVGKYTRLKGNGRDVNVWIETAQYGKDVYGYIANPQWWNMDAVVEFAQGVKAYDLYEDRPIAGRQWKLRMAPYTIHTFKIVGHATDRDETSSRTVVSCHTDVSRKGRTVVNDLISDLKTTLRDKQGVLKTTGADRLFTELINRSQEMVETGDYSLAYNELTCSPATVETDRLSANDVDE